MQSKLLGCVKTASELSARVLSSKREAATAVASLEEQSRQREDLLAAVKAGSEFGTKLAVSFLSAHHQCIVLKIYKSSNEK